MLPAARCTRRRPGEYRYFSDTYISPYNVDAFLNPLLVSVMAEGYLFNLHRGAPAKGGTMIILHPCTDEFDKDSTWPA